MILNDMQCDIFSPLLAWSWAGHGNLTSIGIGLAILKMITLGKSALLKQLGALSSGVWRYDEEGPDTVREAEITKQVSDADRSPPADAAAVARLFSDLPTRVQVEDIHLGNIPWGVGEALDSTGQVRHFMRSRPEVTSVEAYQASYAYIRRNCIDAWDHLKNALNPVTSWTDRLHDSVFIPNAVNDCNQGKKYLAKALHTIEDSYAPGHVRRILFNIIEEVHIWDDANKNPSGDWPGHDALDNPEHPMSRPLFEAAKPAIGGLIACIFSNLDQTEHDFLTELDNYVFSRLARGSLAPDTPVQPSTSATA
jgi:hypothetical protein